MDRNDAKAQHAMREQTQARLFDVTRTFNEIMSGPNPLTRAEVERLVAKRPERYGALAAWLRNS